MWVLQIFLSLADQKFILSDWFTVWNKHKTFKYEINFNYSLDRLKGYGFCFCTAV